MEVSPGPIFSFLFLAFKAPVTSAADTILKYSVSFFRENKSSCHEENSHKMSRLENYKRSFRMLSATPFALCVED